MAKARMIDSDSDDSVTEQAQEFAELNEAEGGELFRAVDELRGTAGVHLMIVKVTPAEEAGFCGNMPVAEFSHERVRDLYGAGLYKIRVKGPKGFLPGGGPLQIAKIQKPAVAPSGNFESFLEIMERKDAERRARTDDWIKLAIPVLGTLATALIQRPQGNDVAALVTALKPAPGPSLADLSTTMMNMRSLTAPEKNESTVDTVLRVFEAAQNLSGDKEGSKGEGSNWLDIIRDLIKVAPEALKPMMEARMSALTAMRPTVPVQSIPVALAPNLNGNTTVAPTTPVSAPSYADGAVNPGTDMRIIWEAMAKAHLAKVASWAEKDRNPVVYAEVFVDELPDLKQYLTLDQVLGHLQNPQWFEIICALEPRLKTHRDYCDEMRLTVVDIVNDIKREQTEELPNPPVAGSEDLTAET